ncbi:MAG: C39 family peptidase [Candidatus Roizmanbacteria bacterium]|nr:C39 family peptidase [Candidatus Roizmanbacteria bacterium]
MKFHASSKLFTTLGLWVAIFFTLSILFTPKQTWGVVCERKDSASQEELQSIIDACTKQVNDLGQQRNTLTKQIQYMDSQIYLTELNIQENQQSVERIKKEITSLGERIGELNSTLTHISETTTDKIRAMYKRQRRNPMLSTLASDNLTTLLRSVQYLKRTQENDRNILLRLQDTKVNFNEQKTLREEKETELNILNDQLASYKISLAAQQRDKEVILSETQNDEKTYQQILSRARTQISAFKTSAVNSGVGGVIGANSLGTGDGSYYSQRDERWAYTNIGNSSESIGSVGCLVTSVAMVLKSKGTDVTPTDIAANSCYFDLCTTAYMKFSVDLPGGHRRFSSFSGNISTSDINNKLDGGEPVIVGLYPSWGGQHFIVLKKVDGDDWMMYDPLFGPNIKFSEHYTKDKIFSAEIIT